MRPTSQCWTVVGVGLVFVGLAVVAQNPQFVYATVGLGAWLFVSAITAMGTFRTHSRTLTVSYAVDAQTTRVEQPVAATADAYPTGANSTVSGDGDVVVARRGDIGDRPVGHTCLNGHHD